MTEMDKATGSAEMAEYISDTRQACLNRVQQMSSDDFTRIEKRLKRKLDLRLTGMIVFIYILNYLDRVGLISPNVDDLHRILNAVTRTTSPPRK